MRLIYSILYILIASVCSAQTFSSVHVGAPYDTILLKNDYKLIFSKTEALRVIQLVGHARDTIIMAESIYSSERSVGWLGADFEDFFVLYFTNDDYIFMMHIFKKQNGKRIASGTVIDMDTLNEVVYFEDFNVRNMLSVYDFKRAKMEKFPPPGSPCLHWWYCIKIIGITEKELTIEYTGHNNSKIRKKYVR